MDNLLDGSIVLNFRDLGLSVTGSISFVHFFCMDCFRVPVVAWELPGSMSRSDVLGVLLPAVEFYYGQNSRVLCTTVVSRSPV
jgi:hypothetical protein